MSHFKFIVRSGKPLWFWPIENSYTNQWNWSSLYIFPTNRWHITAEAQTYTQLNNQWERQLPDLIHHLLRVNQIINNNKFVHRQEFCTRHHQLESISVEQTVSTWMLMRCKVNTFFIYNFITMLYVCVYL